MLEALMAVFGPAVPTMIGKAAEKVFENRLGLALEDSDERRQAGKACHQAMEEWLIALVRNFQSLGYDDDEIGAFFADYMEALPRFLADEEANEELLRPFTDPEPEPRIDADRLLARWQALSLPALPDDFNIRGACTAYVKALTRKRIITPELRSVFQAQTAHGSFEVLKDIRGAWPTFDLDQYACAARGSYQTVDLSALAPAGRDDPDEPIQLRDVFVAQDARRSRLSHSLPRDYLVRHGLDPEEEAAQAQLLSEKWGAAKREPVLDLIADDDAKHCVILGDPGAGKSVITRYLLLSLLDESAPEPPAWRARLGNRLPFLIELREFIAREAEGRCNGFLEYLHYLGARRGFGLNVTELQQILCDQPSLVMFDGLDEIFDPQQRERIAREITGFARQYASVRVLVTSRIAGFHPRPFEEAEFAIFTLDELDDEQIKTFVNGWFRVAYHERADEAESRGKHVLETLRDRPAVRALAGNPLLLTIIAIIARHQQLPHSRKDLYAHALSVMCHNWDLRRHLVPKDSPLRDLEADHKLALLRRIAWRMQEGGRLKANAIEDSDLRVEIEAYFKDEWDYEKATCIRCSREMIEVLQIRNHILCPYGPGLYGFIHRTFLEYLCAASIIWRFKEDRSLTIEGIRDGYVLRHADEDAWHEVIRLLTAQLQPKFAGELISALVPEPADARQQTMKLQLAFECLAEREPRELTQLAPICDSLLDALYGWIDAEVSGDIGGKKWDKETRFAMRVGAALAAVGAHWPEPALDQRGLPRSRSDERSFNFFYRSLIGSLAGSIWSKLPETEALLRDRARTDENATVRSAALEALAQHFRDAPETEPLLRDRARDDHDAFVRGAALRALAEHFRDAPETEPLLLDRARTDENAAVRYGALMALAQHFRDAAETKPLLLDFARTDENADMRNFALQALALQLHHAAETKLLLLDRVRTDENAAVRYGALMALDQHFRDAPETKLLLFDRARNDEDADVRSVALEALAQHFRDAPETQPLLLDRAREDEDASVRGVALLAWARAYNTERNARLLSRDLYGADPGLDSHETIGEKRVEEAAERLGLTRDEVRAAYEELARQLPLILSWQPGTPL